MNWKKILLEVVRAAVAALAGALAGGCSFIPVVDPMVIF